MDDFAVNDFWEASKLDEFKIREYAASLNSYDSDDKELRLAFSQAATARPLKKSKLSAITNKRKSTKSFTGRLSRNEIVDLLSSLSAKSDLEHRTYPSAGATYSVETFVLIPEGSNLQVCYYDALENGLVNIVEAKAQEDQLTSSLNIDVSGPISAIVLFVGISNRVTDKYQERGIRFMLLEAGAMMQQLSLALAITKNAGGCVAGGAYDDELVDILALPSADRAKLLCTLVVGKT